MEMLTNLKEKWDSVPTKWKIGIAVAIAIVIALSIA